ncbi:hypothetical protein AB4851_08800 [Burkholderia sp. 22PA0099]|uniref:hypothetical protein n=1 Tax=Burkholderia sp. 22PA0099 TaxID=3237372 RepID=UPI0039C4E2CD
MIDDGKVGVLVERMNNYLDRQARMEGQLQILVQMQLTLAQQGTQIETIQNNQSRLFKKSDEVEKEIALLKEKEITPLRDDMIGNKRAIKVLSGVGSLIVAASGLLYSQWRPWQADLQAAKEARDAQITKYSQDVGHDLQAHDRRLTVLEFRANNVDHRSDK